MTLRIPKALLTRIGQHGQQAYPEEGAGLMLGRIDGTAEAIASPLGLLPTEREIDREAAGVSDADWEALMRVDRDGLAAEAADTARYLATFGDRLPAEIGAELEALRARLES